MAAWGCKTRRNKRQCQRSRLTCRSDIKTRFVRLRKSWPIECGQRLPEHVHPISRSLLGYLFFFSLSLSQRPLFPLSVTSLCLSLSLLKNLSLSMSLAVAFFCLSLFPSVFLFLVFSLSFSPYLCLSILLSLYLSLSISGSLTFSMSLFHILSFWLTCHLAGRSIRHQLSTCQPSQVSWCLVIIYVWEILGLMVSLRPPRWPYLRHGEER